MTTCPTCGGTVVTSGARAWCIKSYALGGCGGYFMLSRLGRWVRQP